MLAQDRASLAEYDQGSRSGYLIQRAAPSLSGHAFFEERGEFLRYVFLSGFGIRAVCLSSEPFLASWLEPR